MKESTPLLLNQKRYFGDIIGDGIKLITVNFKAIFAAFVTFVLPCIFIPFLFAYAFGMLPHYFGDNALNGIIASGNIDTMTGLFFLISMLFMAASIFMLNLIVFATTLVYEENGNQPVDFSQLKTKMGEIWGRYLLALIVLILSLGLSWVLIALGMFVILDVSSISVSNYPGAGTLVFAFVIFSIVMLLFIWLAVILQPFTYIMIRENLSISEAWSRSFKIMKGNWWSMFGILFVTSLIAGVVAMVFSIPYYIVLFMGFTSALEVGAMESVGLLGAITLLVSQIGRLFLNQYPSVCATLKYYDMIERTDGTSLSMEIDELGTGGDSLFENEGEY